MRACLQLQAWRVLSVLAFGAALLPCGFARTDEPQRLLGHEAPVIGSRSRAMASLLRFRARAQSGLIKVCESPAHPGR